MSIRRKALGAISGCLLAAVAEAQSPPEPRMPLTPQAEQPGGRLEQNLPQASSFAPEGLRVMLSPFENRPLAVSMLSSEAGHTRMALVSQPNGKAYEFPALPAVHSLLSREQARGEMPRAYELPADRLARPTK